MSLFRNTVWFLKGMREYTQSGYLAAAKKFQEEDLNVDCSGKEYMITGANSGIGKQAAMEIAMRGGTIHMVCRNPKLAEEVKVELVEATKNDNIHVHILDMSKPKEIHRFASQFSSTHERLDALLNNAGCMVNTREVTEDGLEKNFATNTLGTHILTARLVPLLQKATQPRVIIVTSGGMLTKKLDTADLQFEQMHPFDGTMAYAQNKRQQVIMAEQYAVKHPEIRFSTMHPGWADTPAVKNSMPQFYNKMQSRLRTPKQGADTLVWLAISNAIEAVDPKMSGNFFQDRTTVSKHLPLSWTQSLPEDDSFLMKQLDELLVKYRPNE